MEQQLRGPSLKWRMLVDGSHAKGSLSGGVGPEQGLQVSSTFELKRGLKPVKYKRLNKVGKVMRLHLIVFAETNKINAT